MTHEPQDNLSDLADDDTQRMRVWFMDALSMDQTAATQPSPSARPRRRIISTVGSETAHVRANVQDAARAVLTWLASVTDHQAGADLNQVLDRCLRPGPDVTRLNHAALAEQIYETLGIRLTAKRVHSAIRHLRKSREKQTMTPTPANDVTRNLQALHRKLQTNYVTLTQGNVDDDHASLHREIATQILTAVRSAASRLIEADFGEGIPASLDVDALESQFLDFVRDQMNQLKAMQGDHTLAADMHRLLVTLNDYDASPQLDMQVVMHGSRVCGNLLGPDSPGGCLARLNVLVIGRHMLPSEDYVTHLRRLAAQADRLNDDPAAASYINWARKLPEDQRVPSPTRIASYARNNAATHTLDKLFENRWQGSTDDALKQVQNDIDIMIQRDRGFVLLRVTRAMYLTVRDKLHENTDDAWAYFQQLGHDDALSLLGDLMRYESNLDLVQAVKAKAIAALPSLKDQLIRR